MEKARILIIEDETITAEDLRRRIVSLGHEALVPIDYGEKALEKINELLPDLILMDIRLKGDMDGVDVANQIRSTKEIPVIFLTAFSDQTTLQRASLSEPFGYLLKPIRTKDLQTAIEVALIRHRAENALRENERKFRSFVEQSSEGILLTDEEGNIIEWNNSAEQITGIKKDELIQRPIWTSRFHLRQGLFKPEEANKSETLQALHSGEAPWLDCSMEVTYQHEDDNQRIAQQKLFPIKTEKGFRIGGVILDITARIEAEKRLQHLAMHDPLTDLPNRLLFYDRLHHAIAKARRMGRRVAILYLDLDKFKSVNDTYGHETGDLLLQQIARRLDMIVRQSDTVARLGGDEFTVCVEDVSDYSDATMVAQKILEALLTPFDIAGHEVAISASIGISLFPDDGENIKELLIKADAAMYRVKHSNRSNFQFFTPAE